MDILAIPFHQYLNIEKAESNEYIFKLEERPECLNHLGTIHACVQLSLAEATSGEYLLTQFNEYKSDLIPVVRKTEAKYHKPANGTLFSKATFTNTTREEALAELASRNRMQLQVKVEVFDSKKIKSLSANFEWFITRKNQ